MAWERVYISGPSVTKADKKKHALVVGVSRYTKAETDYESPMMQACGRGLSMLVWAVLLDTVLTHSEINPLRPRLDILT